MSRPIEIKKRESIWTRPWRILRCHYFKLMRIDDPPHQVALGLAIGVFVGCLPIVPFQFVTALFLAFIFKGSKVASILGTLVSNPLNFVPFYMMVYCIGRAATGLNVSPPTPAIFHPDNFDFGSLLTGSRDLLIVLMTGGFILAIPSSIIFYILGLKAIIKFRRRKASRALKRYGLKITKKGDLVAASGLNEVPRQSL